MVTENSTRTGSAIPDGLLDWSVAESNPLLRLNKIQSAARDKLIDRIKSGKIRVVPVEKCMDCEGRDFEQLCDRDRFGLPFTSVICRDCGLVATHPFISEESLPAYYDEIYHPLTFGKRSARDRLYLVDRRQGRKIFDFCKRAVAERGIRGGTAVEIGCASGSNLAQFRNSAKRCGIELDVAGCDYESSYAQIAEDEFGLRFFAGGVETLIAAGIKADVVIMSHVLEHMYDLKAIRASLCQLISPNGVVYVEVPGVGDLHRKYQYQYDYVRYRTHAHIYDFCLTTLAAAMKPEFSLDYGDEYCRAVFVGSGELESDRTGVQTSDGYSQIKASLAAAETARSRHPWRAKVMRDLRRATNRIRRMF